MQLLAHADDGTPIYASPSSKLPYKRVRRGKRKMSRNAYQRENVLTDRDCLTHSQRSLTEAERAAKCLPAKPKPSAFNYRSDNYEGNHKINHHNYTGVTTHPIDSFDKDRDYQHHPLTTPSHLWCDVVHATDADVTKGNRK